MDYPLVDLNQDFVIQDDETYTFKIGGQLFIMTGSDLPKYLEVMNKTRRDFETYLMWGKSPNL